MAIKIAFTGTQRGMTFKQALAIPSFLRRHPNFIGIHGDCVGADSQFDRIARAELGFEHMEVHPCNLADKRAHCTIGPRDLLFTVMAPLQRNEIMVNDGDIVLATPGEDTMQLRSGTWATVRYALKQKKPVFIVLQSGEVMPW